jgi:hypothetical protein
MSLSVLSESSVVQSGGVRAGNWTAEKSKLTFDVNQGFASSSRTISVKARIPV